MSHLCFSVSFYPFQFRASGLFLALMAPVMAIPELQQGGTQGWELRSVSLNELSRLGLATGPSNRRPIFQNIDGGRSRGHHDGPPPRFQQVHLLSKFLKPHFAQEVDFSNDM